MLVGYDQTQTGAYCHGADFFFLRAIVVRQVKIPQVFSPVGITVCNHYAAGQLFCRQFCQSRNVKVHVVPICLFNVGLQPISRPV
jgi:hypothetical protein